MGACKEQELIHIGLNSLCAALHSWNCVALSLQAFSLAPNSPKKLHGSSGSTSGMLPGKITSEHKYVIVWQFGNISVLGEEVLSKTTVQELVSHDCAQLCGLSMLS